MIVPTALLLLLAASTDPPPLELTLDDCIRLALQNNLSMQVARLDAQAAVDDFNAAWGAFDTIYFIDGTGQNATSPPGPPQLAGSQNVGSSPATTTESLDMATGFRGTFLTGTTWSLEAGTFAHDSHARAPPPSVNDPDPQAFNSESVAGRWALAVTQPLLRNGADDFPTSGLELARHDATIAALASEDIANNTLETVSVAYWNLVYTRQNVKTSELSVQLATELLDITKRKFEQGLQNRLDVTQTETEVAGRKQQLITAKNDAEAAEDLLRTLVIAPSNKEDWGRPIVALTPPSPPQAGEIDLDAAIETALANRPDVASARQSVERAEIEVRRASNLTRPLLDLTGSYGINSDEANYGDAFNELDDTSFNEARVTLNFEMSIGNRTAGYLLRRRQVERQRSGVTLRETEMNAVADVRAAVRDVQSEAERVTAAVETTRLANETYEGEKRRLENDLSTPFLVRQAQRDLFTAIDAQTRAQLDLENARAALLRAQGRLLHTYGVERSLPELSLEAAPPRP